MINTQGRVSISSNIISLHYFYPLATKLLTSCVRIASSCNLYAVAVILTPSKLLIHYNTSEMHVTSKYIV